jgi:membrane-associated phospholipid phosphatase
VSEPQHNSRPLVPPALRRAAAIITGLCAATLAILGALVAHGTQPTGLDAAVANLLEPRFGPGGFGGPGGGPHLGFLLGPFGQLGGPVPMTFLTGLLCYCCLALRRYRGAALLAISVVVASSLTEFVLKPLIHRTYAGSLSFPSGHATAAFALAAGVVILLADPPGSPMPRSMRAVLSLLTLGIACAAALGLVAGQMHYFTDTVGGAAVGIGVALSAALAIDRFGRRPAAATEPASVTAEPAEPAHLA